MSLDKSDDARLEESLASRIEVFRNEMSYTWDAGEPVTRSNIITVLDVIGLLLQRVDELESKLAKLSEQENDGK